MAPFNVKIARQTAGSSTQWIGEALPKPVSKLGFGNLTLPWSKSASIIVVTKELMMLTEPGSAEQLEQTLRDEMVVFTDQEFLSATAAVANVRPAGILAGVTPITATADLAADLKTLVNTFFANRPYPLGPYVVTSPATASKIAALDVGRDVSVNGGTLLGLPAVITPAAGAKVIVLDAPAIYVADGGIDLDISEDAAIEMVDTSGVPGATTVYSSMFQMDEIAIESNGSFIGSSWQPSVQFLAVP